MIKWLFQFLTGMEWGDYPDKYLIEDYLVDCAVLVFGVLIYVRWWPF